MLGRCATEAGTRAPGSGLDAVRSVRVVDCLTLDLGYSRRTVRVPLLVPWTGDGRTRSPFLRVSVRSFDYGYKALFYVSRQYAVLSRGQGPEYGCWKCDFLKKMVARESDWTTASGFQGCLIVVLLGLIVHSSSRLFEFDRVNGRSIIDVSLQR